jgi:hypothetical protein
MEQPFNSPEFGQVLLEKKLQEKIQELQNELKRREHAKKDEITMAQQLLLLYYLGFITSINLNNKSKSILLSKILNKDSENIRKKLSTIDSPKISYSDIKNVKNLEFVLEIFISTGMYEAAERVKVDLNKVKQV